MAQVVSPFRLHNYAHQSGFSLGIGVCNAIFTFIEEGPSLSCYSEDAGEFPVNDTWKESHPGIPADKIPHFIGFLLKQLFLLNLHMNRRRKISPKEVIFLLSVIRGVIGS
jgi:hypothetical protein